MAEKKYTENLGLTKQDETDFVDGPEISRSFSVLDEVIGKLEDLTTEEKRSLIGAINQINSDLLEKVYPVGSVYISVNNENPGNIFGGTWERFANGRTLVGVNENDGSFNTVKKAGGHKEMQSHAHTMSGDGAHSHTVGYYMAKRGTGNADTRTPDGNDGTYGTYFGGGHTHTINSAGNGNSGNLPPYITVYFWIRTA